MAKIQNHVENTIDNLRDSAGNVHEINAAYLDGKGAEEYVTTDDLPTQATSTKLGLVKSSTTGTAANRDYNVQVNSDGTMKVNVPWTYINTSHSHSAGVGLVGSGRAGASGTYTYKAKLRSETALTVDSAAATTSGNVYPVAVDKSGYLSLNVPLAGFEEILKGIKGRTQVEWNALNTGEYGSNSTYNGATLPPVILENNSGFWNSASGRPLDISFHFTKKERITTLQVKCPPYSGVNPTMTVYYAQNGDDELTLYKEIATISTIDRKIYEFNEEGISADYWVVRFTSSGWIDLRLCSPSGLFTTGLYTEECHQQIMDRFNGYQPVGDYQPKGNYVTTDTAQTITGRKTFNSPANVNGQEVATAIFKTSNGGQLIIGKEGPNSGTMLRFDQTAGKTRLQFRASATLGAMVWSQPEKGATLYFDLTNSAGVSTRTTLDARSGTIARTSDIGNGKITIQKNGTEVGSFTTNQSSGKTINLTIAKSDVGLGNVDNTADKDKSVKYASSAGDASNAFKLVSEDKQTEYDWITIHNIFDRISVLERYTKVYSVDTNTTTSNNHGTPINSKFESNVETLSVEMSTHFDTYPTNQCIYADRVGDVTPNELKVGDIIVIDGYLSRYVSDKTTVTTNSSGQARIIRVKFTAINKQYLDRINGKANVGHTHAISEITNLQSTLNGKQETLVSGTNIKTINGNSILGNGNLSLAMSIAQKSINIDIINATSTKSCYVVIDNWLVQWGVFIGAHGDTTNWEVTFPKAYYWYPAVILQTKDTITNNQGIPYSNGAVVTSNDGGASFTFQLRRSETCPVYWIAIGGLH